MKTATEAGFLDAVLEYAALRQWRTAHFRPARTATGWRTAVQGDGKGFPDCVFVRGPRMVVAELKMPDGRLTPEQRDWIEAMRALVFVEVYVWTPNEWSLIENVLR